MWRLATIAKFKHRSDPTGDGQSSNELHRSALRPSGAPER